MLIDAQQVFSDKQAITGDAVSTNVVNLGKAGLAPGNPLSVIAQVEENFNTLTSLTITVQSSTTENFAAPINHQSVTVALAGLTAGRRIDLGSLLDGVKQYVRLDYNVTGTDPTTGEITAVLQPFGDQTLVNQA
ncbi:MAG: hypothetical protein RBT70_08805 [Alphaproteobacteria bacterium]|jgi:hypothetical protein|nr:hypothetical protein [Alphaproteobacteria bacterium]